MILTLASNYCEVLVEESLLGIDFSGSTWEVPCGEKFTAVSFSWIALILARGRVSVST